MKIYAASKEDIIRRQRENEEKYEANHERYEKQYDSLKIQTAWQAEKLKDTISNLLEPYVTPLSLEIDAEYGSVQKSTQPYYDIFISANDYSKRHSSNKSVLDWHIFIKIDEDGQVIKSSGVGSGFDATTPEAVQNLQLSVDCLKEINNIDWHAVLSNNTPPKYEDYITDDYNDAEYYETKRNLERELLEQEVRETIGKDEVIYGGKTWSGYGNIYYKIIKETAKQYVYIELSDSSLERGKEEVERLSSFNPERISKDRFFEGLVPTPLEIVKY